jgi:hypothetical protein
MIANHQQFLVSLEQLQELELALASVKRDASSPVAFTIQATSVQKEICRFDTKLIRIWASLIYQSLQRQMKLAWGMIPIRVGKMGVSL